MSDRKQAHTPGPWRVAREQAMSALKRAEMRAINKEGARQKRIRDAAPDLLAACEAALAPIDYDCSNKEQTTLRDHLRAAIAKAKG